MARALELYSSLNSDITESPFVTESMCYEAHTRYQLHNIYVVLNSRTSSLFYRDKPDFLCFRDSPSLYNVEFALLLLMMHCDCVCTVQNSLQRTYLLF